MFKQSSERQADNPDFWESHWEAQDIFAQMEAAKRNELIPIFKKYLPQKGRNLEAGCGQGIFVATLDGLGYNIEGIDFDEKTISQVNALLPKLKIKKGDVFNLHYPDNSLEGYISLGVIEHYENSWQEPLCEAYRVLRSGGTILVSVPYYNYLRRIYLPFSGLQKNYNNFYQYLFTKKEIVSAVKNANFKIQSVEYYGKTKTLISLPIIGSVLRRKHLSMSKSGFSNMNIQKKSNRLVKKLIKFIPNSLFAHMIMVIGTKP